MALDRTALRNAYRLDEDTCLAERMEQASSVTQLHEKSADLASKLILDARKRESSGLDAFLHSYGLDTEEGIALMCLAEALLRVPDEATADALIRDKMASIRLGRAPRRKRSDLRQRGDLLADADGRSARTAARRSKSGMANALRRAIGPLGEPVIRKATCRRCASSAGSSSSAAPSRKR